jgi:hypothetical protein
MIMHENVREFLVSILTVHLHSFTIFQFDTDPSDVGFTCSSRPRQYLICVNKKTGRVMADMHETWQAIKDVMQTGMTSADVVFATPAEVRVEELELCRVRHLDPKPYTAIPDLDYTLSESEQSYIAVLNDVYKERTGEAAASDVTLCYNLSDNPNNRLSWSLSSSMLPTFRRNASRLYFPAYRRCLTRGERLAAMGFPTHESLSAASHVEQVRVTKAQQSFLLGNAMHLPNAASIFVLGLACASRV